MTLFDVGSLGCNAGITDTGAEYLAKAVEDSTSIKAIRWAAAILYLYNQNNLQWDIWKKAYLILGEL